MATAGLAELLGDQVLYPLRLGLRWHPAVRGQVVRRPQRQGKKGAREDDRHEQDLPWVEHDNIAPPVERGHPTLSMLARDPAQPDAPHAATSPCCWQVV